MKKQLLTLFLSSLFLFNCSENSESETENFKPDGHYITCKLNGESFEPTLTLGSYSTKYLTITGSTKNPGKIIIITIENPEKGKTYNLNNNDSEVDLTSILVETETDKKYSANFSKGSGSITLTHLDEDSAAGIFNAITVYNDDNNDTIKITSGKFSLTSFFL
ncbi:hypothetical protein LG651_09865 [Tamlana sp. 62-3]|uniref:Uncharacterized protein n=1 Tax=Neotamlana sargassicola TaxID=2883125 RepID=A0A9X1I657_9FLAO|nr:DUF6252 family protein [Tamlana sargassicola]MCB4808560.1 hypothetical protein [Tamlana sargassicola]